MERKRKLPARAAARAEQAPLKKRAARASTGAQAARRSETPAVATDPEPEPAPVEEPPPPLPKSVTAGQPLPTVDTPQPDDLSNKDFQSVSESGVLAESLTRSRQKWISDNIFERYWSKPTKKKGVVHEEPNNPPKESMMKLGQVTITIEPHTFDAVMFAVKDPKPPPPPSNTRPILQYGPPNGVMPPRPASKQPTPKPSPTVTATPTPTSTQPATPAPGPTQIPTKPQSVIDLTIGSPAPPTAVLQSQAPPPAPIPPAPRPPAASPHGIHAVLNPVPPQPVQRPPLTVSTPGPASVAAPVPPAPPAARPAAAKPAPGTDPIILTLAEKAGEDPHLRDLMKRVAQGDAAKHELERFQAIIDAISAESKRKGMPVGPSADRLMVDNRTVRYFADEVRAILDIVLMSNPKQTSTDLRPPQGSDPLVVALVKAALDDKKISDTVRRISTNKPLFSDATELQVVLNRLFAKLVKELDLKQKAQSPQPGSASTPRANGALNGHVTPTGSGTPTVTQPTAASQALRSKGPPPPPKPDISAVVFEFVGGSGDRFLFPKFSILEYLPTAAGQQVIASFLIVRKGSKGEYPMADPDLDYYQPVTIRLFTPLGRHLENLARVVAPQDEVRRYMDDIMDTMMRAEYILLAMRLPRADAKETEEGKEKEDQPNGNGKLPLAPAEPTPEPRAHPTAVLWGTTKKQPENRDMSKSRWTNNLDDDAYQSWVAGIGVIKRSTATGT
ncbi:hypothetical protein OQA88_3007 [Cercophora sp. LCS_1]